MHSTQVFVGLGGNIGDSLLVLKQAVSEIKSLPNVGNLEVSRFFRTTPVSPIPQDHYLNAVCTFTTTLDMHSLFNHLQWIEIKLGKVPKDKQAARIIDLDLLLFGNKMCHDKSLQVPHPEWKNRLFVLIPMLDLIKEILVPDPSSEEGYSKFDLQKFIDNFFNKNNEMIIPIQG